MSTKWQRTQTQVVIRDLQAWIDQLYLDHSVRLEVIVSLPASSDGIDPGVSMMAYQVDDLGHRSVCHADWKTVSATAVGGIEAAALQMASLLLLQLDNSKALSSGQPSLWDELPF